MLQVLPADLWRHHILTFLTLQGGIFSFTSTCKLARYQLLQGHRLAERLILTEKSEVWCKEVGISIEECRNRSAPFLFTSEVEHEHELQYTCFVHPHDRFVVLNHVYDFKAEFRHVGTLRRMDCVEKKQKVIGIQAAPGGRVALSYVDQIILWDALTLRESLVIPVYDAPRLPSRPVCFPHSVGLLVLSELIDERQKLAVWDIYSKKEGVQVHMICGRLTEGNQHERYYSKNLIPLKSVNSNLVISLDLAEATTFSRAYVWDIISGTDKGRLALGRAPVSVQSICALHDGGVVVGGYHQDLHYFSDNNNRQSDIKIFNSNLLQVHNLSFRDTIEKACMLQIDNGSLVTYFSQYGLCVFQLTAEGTFKDEPTKAFKKALEINHCVMLDGKNLELYQSQPHLLRYGKYDNDNDNYNCKSSRGDGGKSTTYGDSVLLIQRRRAHIFPRDAPGGVMNLISLDQQTIANEFKREWEPAQDERRHSSYHSITNFGHRIHLNPI